MSKAAELAALIGSQSALSHRNFIINGAMQVAQRSTSETGVGGSGGYFTLDRWRVVRATTDGRFTMSQAAVTDLAGFANALKLDCTTADTSLAATDVLRIQQRFEGQDLQQLKKGTSSAEAVTVSFYMKTNKAFTFVCEFDDTDNNRFNSQQFTTSTSWTRHVLTFAGDTTGKLDNDNARSAQIHIYLNAGSNFTSGTYSANTWQSRASTDVNRAVGVGNFFDNTDNEVQITGFQMELGEQATPFEHRSFGDELAKCQRYYFRSVCETSLAYYADSYSNDTIALTAMFPVKMRAKGTGSLIGTWTINNCNSQPSLSVHTPDSVSIFNNSVASEGRAFFHAGANDGFEIDAEL